MPGGPARIEEGIDRGWLRAQAQRDPFTHAFSVWDLEHAPDRVRFVRLIEDGAPRAYLLVWLGNPRSPVVHWIGRGDGDDLLAGALPPRPFVAVVPAGAEAAVGRARGPIATYPLLGMRREPGPVPATARGCRRLRAADTDALRDLAREYIGPLTSSYATADPEREPIWGVFEGLRLVGVARAQVTLPGIWVIGGVFTAPDARNRGVAGATTAALVRTAAATGAAAGLWVRAENTPARRVYERLGFRVAAHRLWVDAGAAAAP